MNDRDPFRADGETWPEYAKRLERRIAEQRAHIGHIHGKREGGNRQARKKIDGLVSALGRMSARWEREREQKLALVAKLSGNDVDRLGQGAAILGDVTSSHGDLTPEERHEVEQFLLPTVEEICGILGPDWVEPRSLKAKEIIRRLLGVETWGK